MEIEAATLVQVITAVQPSRKGVSFKHIRLRQLTDPTVAAILATSPLATKVKTLDLRDGEVTDECVSILLLNPPCWTPTTVDVQGWHCVVALGDDVRNGLRRRFGDRLLTTGQYWGR